MPILVRRPQDSVWEHFIKTPLLTAGHFTAECLYCEKKWTRGRPQELQVYLAKDCLNVDEKTRREYIQKILQLYNDDDTEDNKRFRIEQLNITDFWDVDQNSVEPLSKQKQEAIDQCLLKAFVCCSTPFAVVENPFFVDLIRKLQPGYKLPSREKLAGIMFSHAVVRIEDQVNSILGKAMNLTLGLDGWTNPSGHSIYNFIIMTHDRRKFLYRLQDFSIIKHTAQNLASEIEDVLQKIGPDKFAAVITDNAANCALARSIISEKYPFIVNTRCIAHCVNLITKDVLDSVLHLKLALEKVADDHKDVVKVNIVKIITSRGFFHDVNVVLKVLELLKKTILSVEASNTTFADCFIALIRLASTIKKIPVERGLVNFQNHVINSINKRWESFNVMPYILVYFLHPGYRGNGLKNMWTKISEYAQKLWENMGYNIDDQEILIT
ncbi:ribonuclease H-like domain-containing protein [Rhizophagus irregularis DAOM 181602=DAOM 197198]|nr:ribonuclease H-like domain-containing protein [Rhizophagus irregularis DAOM 181602=DAOM 197198]